MAMIVKNVGVSYAYFCAPKVEAIYDSNVVQTT